MNFYQLYTIVTMDEDKIIAKLLEHDEQLREIKETMATKKELEVIITTQDQIVTSLKRVEEEQTAVLHLVQRINDRLDQHETKIEEHDREINTIKTHLQIA